MLCYASQSIDDEENDTVLFGMTKRLSTCSLGPLSHNLSTTHMPSLEDLGKGTHESYR